MTDFTLKFMDWTPVPPEYMEKLGPIVSDAARLQEMLTTEELDELERSL